MVANTVEYNLGQSYDIHLTENNFYDYNDYIGIFNFSYEGFSFLSLSDIETNQI